MKTEESRSFPDQLRILYALSRYPHIAHTYMSTEISCMQRFGAHIEVWSSAPPTVPFETDVPIHSGTLEDAIRLVAPHLVHTHWTLRGLRHRKIIGQAGLPLTVRGHHPHDCQSKIIDPLHADPTVRRIYMFPQFASKLGPGYSKVRSISACYDPELYYTTSRKDSRLIVRASPARPVKELELFIRVAARCPSHRFVLAVCRASKSPDHHKELMKFNRSLGNPVNLRVNIQHAEVSALVRKAGLYLYTVLPTEEYSMPISVSEAIGAGCYVLARRSEGARAHLGMTGALYDDEDQAVELIQETLEWDEDHWRHVRQMTVNRAAELASPTILRPIYEDWRSIAATAAMENSNPQRVFTKKISKLLKYMANIGNLVTRN